MRVSWGDVDFCKYDKYQYIKNIPNELTCRVELLCKMVTVFYNLLLLQPDYKDGETF